MATRSDVERVEVAVGTRRAVVMDAWPVYWGAAWVGALGALAAVLIGGLLGVAFRAYDVATPGRLATEPLGVPELVASVCTAFFSFVIGGWVASRIAGVRRAETAMLHGAVVWLIGVPLVFLLVMLGARSYFGGWYGGLAGTPAWVATAAPTTAKAARQAAGGAASGLLLGLVGAVLGGWMGSGEPMHFAHYVGRKR